MRARWPYHVQITPRHGPVDPLRSLTQLAHPVRRAFMAGLHIGCSVCVRRVRRRAPLQYRSGWVLGGPRSGVAERLIQHSDLGFGVRTPVSGEGGGMDRWGSVRLWRGCQCGYLPPHISKGWAILCSKTLSCEVSQLLGCWLRVNEMKVGWMNGWSGVVWIILDCMGIRTV